MESAEQQARDLLDRMGVEGAQSMTAGDVVELANMIAEIETLRPIVEAAKGLALGIDWNKGTHAKIYRPKLLAALKKLRPNAQGEPRS